MEIIKPAAAGTLESSDCQVTVEKGDGGNPFKEVEPSEGADSSDSNGENPFKEVESSEGADSGDDNPFKEVDG